MTEQKENLTEKTKRIEWIDVLRFMGIFSIYLSHLETQAGYFFPFGYRYQTPLFFFIAGAMENLAKSDSSFGQHLKKKFTGIMFPYFFFALVSIVIIFLEGNANAGMLLKTGVQFLLGIRNQLYAPTLWFLPCIFVMAMIFYVLKKMVNNRWVILLIALGLMIASETLLPHRPIVKPSWFWNIDSSLYYFFYYALGYAVFPYVRKLLSSRSVWAHVGYLVSSAMVTIYAIALLTGKDLVAILFRNVPNRAPVILVTGAVLLIWFSIFLAQVLSSITLFQKIGRETLFLCGAEQVIRHLTPPLFALIGWNLTLPTPPTSIIYTFMVVLAATFVVIPILKPIYHSLLELLYPSRLHAKNAGLQE